MSTYIFLSNVDDTQKSSDRNTQSFNNTQPFSSQGFSSQSFTQTQYSESNDVINEAFKDDFDVDDEPIYTANKTPLEDFLEYCSLCSNQKELEEAETEGGVKWHLYHFNIRKTHFLFFVYRK